MIIVNDRPVNGVDLSHWNADPSTAIIYEDWLEFFGHKAVHIGHKTMPSSGIDPKFAQRRILASQVGVRWAAYYMWVVPVSVATPAVQVERFARAVGELKVGESVYLDWEDGLVSLSMVEEISFYMDLMFPGRWFMYINDSTQDMINWLTNNKVNRIPVMHPNYNLENGLKEARKFDAMIWQVGEGVPPGFSGTVPMDYVLKPELLDKVCGR